MSPPFLSMLTRRFRRSRAPEFALPEGVRVYAVGDIHGKADLTRAMQAAIVRHAQAHPCARIIEVYLGDYIDRGLESREVIECLLTPPAPGHERVCLMGNHEETLLNFLEDPEVLRTWSQHGGYATLSSYGVNIPLEMKPSTLMDLHRAFRERFPTEHEQFIRSLDYRFEIGGYYFVHAGVRPGYGLDEQTPSDLLWIREPFTSYKGMFEKYIVHGHTPLVAPEVLPHRADLDVSDAPSDQLCCLIVEGTGKEVMLIPETSR